MPSCPPVSIRRAGSLARVIEVEGLVRARGARASLCVLRDGRVLLDRSFGGPPDALFWIFSASKPFVALLVHQLAVRGTVDLDAPVARYWPEFAGGGKGAVTVRHVLQHRSGFATARGFAGDALAMTDWPRAIRAIERARLRWVPGEVAAYQPIVYGHILGELVRRVTGTSVASLLSSEFLGPLGLTDTFLGLPPGARTATITSTTQMFRAVSGGEVRAVAETLHRGRSTVTVRTSLYDESDRLVAQTTQVQAVIPG